MPLCFEKEGFPIGDGKTRVRSFPENSVEHRASFPKDIYLQKILNSQGLPLAVFGLDLRCSREGKLSTQGRRDRPHHHRQARPCGPGIPGGELSPCVEVDIRGTTSEKHEQESIHSSCKQLHSIHQPNPTIHYFYASSSVLIAFNCSSPKKRACRSPKKLN